MIMNSALSGGGERAYKITCEDSNGRGDIFQSIAKAGERVEAIKGLAGGEEPTIRDTKNMKIPTGYTMSGRLYVYHFIMPASDVTASY